LPIVTSRGVAGVINFTDRKGGEQFQERDIACAKLVASHIAYLLDAVTSSPIGLEGRRGFLDTLERELSRSRRKRDPLVLAFLSLDLGSLVHPRDAASLTHDVAQALRANVRRYDSVAVHAEGVFVLLFPELEEVADHLTDRLVQTVREVMSRIDLKVPVRVGLARCPLDGVSADELIAAAEQRLSEPGGAKRVARS
jgi:GGDEF domain-containing protein